MATFRVIYQIDFTIAMIGSTCDIYYNRRMNVNAILSVEKVH